MRNSYGIRRRDKIFMTKLIAVMMHDARHRRVRTIKEEKVVKQNALIEICCFERLAWLRRSFLMETRHAFSSTGSTGCILSLKIEFITGDDSMTSYQSAGSPRARQRSRPAVRRSA